MSFCIVDLKTSMTDSYVAVVPDAWVCCNNTTCYYPKHEAEKLVKLRAIPDPQTWYYYYSTLRATYASYDVARGHLRKAVDQSDLNSTDTENIGRGKRTKRTPARYTHAPSFNEESDSSPGMYDSSNLSQEDSAQILFPEVPIPATLGPILHAGVVDDVATLDSNSGALAEVINVRPSIFPTNTNPFVENYVVSQQVTEQLSSALVQILREFAILKETVNTVSAKLVLIDQKVDNLQVSQFAAPTEKQISPLIAAPITSLANFREYEDYVSSNDDNFYELVTIIKGIGGTTLSEAMKRAWERVITIEVRAVCNWVGKLRAGVQKHPLHSSRVTEAIFRGILGTNQFRNHKRKELEHETANVMKGAPEALRKKQKRDAAAIEENGQDEA